ncbi:MAG: YhgE/Pip domain-containing protein [Clostridium sp.]|nr:YhgE/Pip domain-containing protein [Clostridium sp.]
MIKNSFKIYKRDLKIIFTNYVVLIVIAALCVIPSLYAWINIKASWDPYSESATSRIVVDVVNEDKGSIINDKEINLGDKVTDGLKENKLLGWKFVSYEEASDDLNNEKVFAAIILPENFSENIASLITENVKKAEIKYMVNEKINAIAPKITIKGVTGVQSNIKDKVIRTTSEAALNIVKELGIEFEDTVLPKLSEASTILHKIEDNFGEINEGVYSAGDAIDKVKSYTDKVENAIPELDGILSRLKGVVVSMGDFNKKLSNSFNEVSPAIKEDIRIAGKISESILSSIDALEKAINAGSNEVPVMLENILTKIDSLDNILASIEESLKILGDGNPILIQIQNIRNNLTNIKPRIQEVKNKIEQGQGAEPSVIQDLKSVSSNISKSVNSIYNNFDNKINPNLNNVFNNIATKLSSLQNILSKAEEDLPDISNMVSRINEVLIKGNDVVGEVKEVLPTAEEKIVEITKKIDEAINSKELSDVLELVKNQVGSRVDFLTNPVNVVEETLFPMGNYGSQMTPFYSTLACWVGLTFLVSILSVETEGDYKPNEVYFGKLLTYTSISIIQAMIIALGDLYYLKIYCLNKGLFFAGMILTSIVFSVVVYSLVSVFGNVGKVVAIILMIFQVAASGGTFPVQLTSSFFIALNPYLPFTYAISFLRESIGGVVESILYRDIRCLLVYIIISILISVLCKKTANKLMKNFTEKFEESGLE